MMFPTSGLFQDLLCPMFSDGSCDRPYCHFKHSKVDPVTIPAGKKEVVQMSIDQPITTPIYKPTPIKLLEQREQLPCNNMHTNESPTAAPSSRLSDVPVYQPTPISELEKYAPCSLSTYGLLGNQKSDVTSHHPQEPPTYSPVVRQKSDVGSPATPTYPSAFSYQPSPAYPPLSTKFSSVDICDDSEVPISCPVVVVPTVTSSNLSSKTPKHKPGITLGESSSPLESQVKYPSDASSACSCKRNAVDETEDPEDSSLTTAAKRQKILALYKDLYGDQLPPVKSKLDVPTASKVKKSKATSSPIPAYAGAPLTRPSKKESEGDRKLQPEPKEDVDGTSSAVILNPRPRAPLKKSDKIPMPIRTRYLDQFIEECLVIYECPNDAYDRALADEQACHDKATSRMAYLNAVIQRLKSLKAEKLQVQSEGVRKGGCGSKQPRMPVTRPEAVKDDAGSAEKQLDEIVQGPLLYDHLRAYLLTEEQLVDNGFPREDKSTGTLLGKAKLLVPDDKRSIYDSCLKNERICARCGARYYVDELGNAVVYQKCVYHWSRPVKQRVPGMGVELRYMCCQSDLGQPGCQLCSEGHVHEANKWFDTEGFVATLPPLVPVRSESDVDALNSPPVNVYAIDCEMVYTTAGCELGRVTIVDSKLQPVLDSIVRPYNTIIDCNTRFSGLNREDIERCDTRITDIQSKLLHLFDSDTILIGHSLESDLVALKLIHSKVVDTSVMFPHRYGPPKKRALRNLVSEMLNRIIQQDDAGHNSLEDAIACMQLVQHRVKEDLRRGKWSLK